MTVHSWKEMVIRPVQYIRIHFPHCGSLIFTEEVFLNLCTLIVSERT